MGNLWSQFRSKLFNWTAMGGRPYRRYPIYWLPFLVCFASFLVFVFIFTCKTVKFPSRKIGEKGKGHSKVTREKNVNDGKLFDKEKNTKWMWLGRCLRFAWQDRVVVWYFRCVNCVEFMFKASRTLKPTKKRTTIKYFIWWHRKPNHS